jgi:2-polyprenyl-6-methoxyphenol hydroxylase-like FAD-dependent oxidoreductase
MNQLGEHAVVLGAGMAGLFAAQVLSEFYRSVSVVERDWLPDACMHRKGVPQGRHLHSFLSRGSVALGELFPGLLDELATAGAVVVDDGDLSRIYTRRGRFELNPSGKFADPAALVLYLASRPFLEFHVRQHVQALANVTLLDGHDVAEPLTSSGAVTGVRVIHRGNGVEAALDADLVIDAMGRGARTPALLERLGYGQPIEKRSAANWAYSSQLLRIPAGRITERMMLIQLGVEKPLAGLMAYENNTWMLTVGRSSDTGAPPTDFAGMLALAEEVTPRRIFQGLRCAQALGDVAVFRNTAGVWRRYDQMSRFPPGLLVIGDAMCGFNPIYGQGMTMAALEALVLRDCLRSGNAELAQRFFRATARHIGPTWALNQANDRVPSAIAKRRSVSKRLRKWTVNALLRAVANDITVAERCFRVTNLIDPPTRLQDPTLISRILAANLRHLLGQMRNQGVGVLVRPSRTAKATS